MSLPIPETPLFSALDNFSFINNNIGSGSRLRNIDIARKILKILSKLPSLIKYVKDRPGHDFMYALISVKVRKELGWEPRVSLDDGLERTVLWYKEHRDWWKTLYK